MDYCCLTFIDIALGVYIFNLTSTFDILTIRIDPASSNTQTLI